MRKAGKAGHITRWYLDDAGALGHNYGPFRGANPRSQSERAKHRQTNFLIGKTTSLQPDISTWREGQDILNDEPIYFLNISLTVHISLLSTVPSDSTHPSLYDEREGGDGVAGFVSDTSRSRRRWFTGSQQRLTHCQHYVINMGVETTWHSCPIFHATSSLPAHHYFGCIKM